jgi:type I restriction enzyme, S subunit
VKAGWEVKPLGEVALFRPNKKEVKSVLLDSDEVSFVPMESLKIDQIALAEHEPKPLGEVYSGYTYFCDGDVLLAKITPCFENGKLGVANGLVNGVGFGSSEFFVFRPANNLLPSYLYHFLNRQSFREWAKGQMTGAVGHKRVPKELIESLPIPLPPLEEQQRIVAILDEAFEGLARARTHAEANLQNARELFESCLQCSFSGKREDWYEKTLAELGAIQTGSTPKTSESGNDGNFIPFIKPGDFKPDGTLDYDNSGLSEKGASVSRLVPSGSALMVCIGATIGKTGFTDRPVTTNQQINAIAPFEGVSGEYIYYQMLTPKFQASVIHRSGQATLPIINKSKWSNLLVRLPKRAEIQAEIVERLSTLRAHLDESARLYREKLADIDALRQSLLQKAFAGELT